MNNPLLCIFAVWATVAAGGCLAGDPAQLDNAAKQARIDQMYQGYKADFQAVRDIAPADLQEKPDLADAVLLDIRTPEEQAISMLPGAITQEAFEAHPEAYAGKTVVTYCTIGARSGTYAAQLMDAGYQVYNLRGSILAWTQAGLPLVDPSGMPTRRVHVYGKRWNLVPEGYEAVY